MNKLTEMKTNGLKQACGFVAAALIASSMFVGSANASMADRGGTVGLVLLVAYQP